MSTFLVFSFIRKFVDHAVNDDCRWLISIKIIHLYYINSRKRLIYIPEFVLSNTVVFLKIKRPCHNIRDFAKNSIKK